MNQATTHSAASLPRRQFTPDAVSLHLAQAMVGRSVELHVGTKKFMRGVVTGVLTEGGKPRIVVGRASYDMSQILTSTPVLSNPSEQVGNSGMRQS